MDKVLFIVGPTAVGKTKLAVEIAKKHNGEIISADSRQVYKYLDIATGKDLKEYGDIKYWGIDLVDPDYNFNVSDFRKYATEKINDILKRNKLPIVVGGTGLYVKSLIDPWETMDIKPNLKLRNKLSNYSVVKLQKKLQKVDSKKWDMINESDRKNPRRLVRAIEVANHKTPKQVRDDINFVIIGLTAPLEYIYQKIDARVSQRIKDGVEQEKEKLLKMGFSLELPSMSATGYRQLPNIQKWKDAEHQYAKKQLTYFKKLKDVIWYNVFALWKTGGYPSRL